VMFPSRSDTKDLQQVAADIDALSRAALTPWPPKEAPMDEMAVAHDRDMQAQAALRELWTSLLDTIANPPARLSQRTKGELVRAASAVREDMEHISRVWD